MEINDILKHPPVRIGMYDLQCRNLSVDIVISLNIKSELWGGNTYIYKPRGTNICPDY